MNNKTTTVMVLLATTLMSGNLLAADEATEEKKEKPWSAEVGLGYVTTSGNTDTTTLNANANVVYKKTDWKHTGRVEKLQSETDNVESANRFFASYQADYSFDEGNYMYGLLTYVEDQFSGFEYQAKASVGYGHRFFLTDAMQLDLEIGPGYRNYKVDNAPDSEDEYLLRLAAKYAWALSDTSSFTEELVGDFGEKQDEWASITGLRAKINNSALAMKISYTIRYLKEVPVGNDNYDREFAVNLIYSY
jgi:putative salt-induced outer membrane protein